MKDQATKVEVTEETKTTTTEEVNECEPMDFANAEADVKAKIKELKQQLRKERTDKVKAFIKRHKGKLIAAAGVAGAAALAAIVASTRNQSSSPVEEPMLDEADDDTDDFIDNVEEQNDVASGF